MRKINNVLLVDDDKINNYLNVRLIKKLEITNDITITYNGQEAIEVLHQKQCCPELILLDINMPVMNGFEFLDHYTRCKCYLEKPILIVLTTSENQDDMEKLKYYAAVSGYLNKPLTPEKLNGIWKTFFE